ncbi:MAG: hypothetical protein Crog4KO_19320 [Crocinitomicaceae bacterium]
MIIHYLLKIMTKSVQFNVAAKQLNNISGTCTIQSIVGDEKPSNPVAFSKGAFTINLDTSADYYAVCVKVETFQVAGTTYKVAGNPLSLMATLYLSDVDTAAVCPESSVASLYAFARMTSVDENGWVSINGTERNMKIAYGMKQNFYKTEGEVSDRIQSSPNGFETNSYPMFNSLCNLMYYSMTDASFYQQFLEYAWSDEGQSNTSFLGALRNILHDPFHNAKEIYQMIADKPEVYDKSLVSMDVPDDQKAPKNWTLTFKSNTSGAKNFIPSGTAFAVFDANDRVWVANNFRAGSGDSGTHCLVYNHDASPAPFSPVQGGGLLGVGFGASINPEKTVISFGNFGWGSEYNNPQEGSIAQFNYDDGTPISPSNGFTPGLSRVQGMEYDNDGNLWMASVGCQDPFAPAPTGVYEFEGMPSAVVVYKNGDAKQMIMRDEFPVKNQPGVDPADKRTQYLKIFDVTPDNKGGAYVSCIGHHDRKNIDNCAYSAVYYVTLEGDEINVIYTWFSDYVSGPKDTEGYESLRQIAIAPNGDVVVVGVSSSRATVLSPDLKFKMHCATEINAPWGVKIDSTGDLYFANFGPGEGQRLQEDSLDLIGPYGVTLLRNPEDPKSSRLMTVPTGGHEVTLANNHSLYGSQTYPEMKDGKPTGNKIQMKSYSPIMRLTSTNIDGAGNLWCMNNWKPSAFVDVTENPGGDGVVIFLGIAEPE